MNRCFKSIFNRRTGTSQVVSEKACNAGKTGSSVSKPLLAMLLGLSACTGLAQTSTQWNGAVDSNWSNTANWSNGLPSNTNIANIAMTGSPHQPVIENHAATAAQRLLLDSGNTLTVGNGGTLNVAEFISISRTTNAENAPGGTLNVVAGGKVTANSLFVGDGINSGKAIVSGTGSSLTINLSNANQTNRFVVGAWGDGELTVADGASISLGGTGLLELGSIYNGREATGTLKIGTGGLAGTVSATFIKFGTATSSIVANFSDVMTLGSNISGSGSLVKMGAGTLILTGDNTYTGNTNIDAGTLAIAAGGSLAASGAVNLTAAGTGFDISAGGNQAIGQLNGVAGATVNLGGNTLTLGGTGAGAGNGNYDGMITGTGRLVKNGNGIQTLFGANTFSGGVTLNAGGLTLGNNGALGTGVLTVARSASIDASTALNVGNDISLASGTVLNLLGSNALTLGGPIYGLGGILKSGAGTLTLRGANSYTGGTTINAGTLAIGAGANLASTGAVNLAGTGTLDISAGGNQTIGTLAGVAGSSVALGNNTLSFGSGNDSDFNGSIVGNGGLVKNGAGMQTLGGVSTFGGGVILNAGGLSVGNNAALGTGALTVSGNSTLEASSQVTLTNNVALNNASLTVSGSNNLNLNGILSGSGILLKDGSGTLTLNGINTNTGVTIINAGALRVSNANSSLMTVNNGATLIGTGSVGGTTVKNGATVHAETGTLTINGDYQQSTNGLLRVDAISATQYGKLDVSGIASFTANTKIDVDVKGGNTLANNNVLSNIIKAGTLNASTFAVTDNSALFNFEAILNSDSVDLRVLSASTTGISDAVREQGTRSAAGAAKVLDGLLNGGASGDTAAVVNAFGQLSKNRDVARAIAQTLPVISGNQAVQGALSTFQGLVQNRNSSSSGTTGLSGGDAFTNKNAWGKVFGSRAEQDNRSGAAGFTADTWGLALGADAEVALGARFGMAYGYAKTSVDGNTDLSGTAQRANIDSHVISAYGSKDIGGNRTFSFQGDIGLNNSKSTRYIDFGGLSRTARADYRTYSAHVGAAIAQAFELNEKTTLTPALRADYTWLKSHSYSESGADALNLNVGSNKTDAFVIGADAYLLHHFSKTSRLDANFGVGYDAINKQGNIVAAYAGAPGQAFLTTGIDHSPWLVRGGIGYTMLASNGTEVSFRYDAEGRSDYLNHTASVKAKWAF